MRVHVELVDLAAPSMAWAARDVCVGHDPALWFAETGDNREAVTICSSCNVRSECLAYAVAAPTFRNRRPAPRRLW